MLHDAAAALTWNQGTPLPATLFASIVERLAAELRSVLARLQIAEPRRGRALIGIAKRCGQKSLLRVLTAPATFAHLAAGPNEDTELLRFAEEAFLAELCRTGERTRVGHDVWTALGDFRFSKRPVARARAYRAPRVGGLPVDFLSPYASGPDIPVAGAASAVDRAWGGRVRADLLAALEGIRSMSEPALSMVHHFTRVIVARADPDHPGMFLSSSSPRYLGRCVLCNPDSASVEELAEALVHESIHALLCCVQIERPFVLDHTRLARLRVISPWTGKELPMDAYLEACFVWYGLVHFWRRDLGGTGFRRPHAARLEQRARSGFLKDPLVEALAPGRAALDGAVIDLVSTMQRSVKQL